MCTILAADMYGLPVSTTHVLSSGVAGTMMANKNGLQRSTIRNIAAAWVFTLPIAALMSAGLFWVFVQFAPQRLKATQACSLLRSQGTATLLSLLAKAAKASENRGASIL